MKKLLLFIILLTYFSVGFAQTRVNIKGKVIDSLGKQPMELSTVAAVDAGDSTLIAYTLTQKGGVFELHGIPAEKKVKLVVSYAGYKSYIHVFTFKKGEAAELGTIELNSKMIGEVLVTAEIMPVRIKKDTIEFDAAAFKTRPNAVIEELLKKLPGIQVDGKGTITVNGKSVSKLLIDGKEFFGTDPKIATRNLDAEIVKQVQVYDDRENDPDHLVSDNDVNKIINIKLKKAIKHSIFGKVYAGAGSQGRYESGGLFNMFRDTLQVSVIGLSNNLNKTAFSNQELYTQGGFDRSGSNNLNNESEALGGQSGGIEKVTSGGFNLNTNYGKKLKLNLIYFYSQRNDVYDSKTYTQQFLSDTLKHTRDTLLTSASNHTLYNVYNHLVTGFVEWRPDTTKTLSYVPKINVQSDNFTSLSRSKTDNSLNQHINASNYFSNGNSTSLQLQQKFMFYKSSRTKPGESFNITHSLRINTSTNTGHTNNLDTSYMPTNHIDTLKHFTDRTSNTVFADLGFSYRYPITKKFIVNIVSTGSYSKDKQDVITYDVKTDSVFLADQSSDLSRDQWTENLKPGITYKITKNIELTAALNTQWQQIQNHFTNSGLAQRYFFLLPTFRITAGHFNLSYNVNVTQPGLSALQPVTINYSTLYSYTGNSLLKPAVTRSGNFNFYTYNPTSQVNFSFYGGFSKQQNMSVSKQTKDPNTLVQTGTTVNRDGRLAANLSFNFNKRFKKSKVLQTDISTNVSTNYQPSLSLLNGMENWQKTIYTSLNQNFNVDWNDRVTLNTGVGYSLSNTVYDNGNLKKRVCRVI